MPDNEFVHFQDTYGNEFHFYCGSVLLFYSPATTNIDNDLRQIPGFRLSQNYPNPFNPITTIQYEIPEKSNVTVIIYNLQGRTINTLVERQQNAGLFKIRWNGTDHEGKQVSTGVYLAKLQAGEYTSVIKMVYIQ